MANAVTIGEVYYVATITGQKNVNTFMTEIGWVIDCFCFHLMTTKYKNSRLLLI